MNVKPVFHGDASLRVRCTHPSHVGQWDLWRNVSLHPPFWEMQGDIATDISLVWGMQRPKKDASRSPPLILSDNNNL